MDRQTAWLALLRSAGIDTRVCRVVEPSGHARRKRAACEQPGLEEGEEEEVKQEQEEEDETEETDSKTCKLFFSSPSKHSPGGAAHTVAGGKSFNAPAIQIPDGQMCGGGGGGSGSGRNSSEEHGWGFADGVGKGGHGLADISCERVAGSCERTAGANVDDELQAAPRNMGLVVQQDTCSTPCAPDLTAAPPPPRLGLSLLPHVSSAQQTVAQKRQKRVQEGGVGSRLSLRKTSSPARSSVLPAGSLED